MEESTIKNITEFFGSPLRRDAISILEKGLESVITGKVMADSVKLSGETLLIKGEAIDLSQFEKIFFIGIGKCALDSAMAMEEILGNKITDGIAYDIREGALKKIKSFAGSHPLSSEKNIEITRDIADLIESASEKDLIIFVISGGGSSLLAMPEGINLEKLSALVKSLMEKGATIGEINTVRKHLSEVLGGGLAKMAHPATVISLIFSDVPGNDIGTVASGPTVIDGTTKEDGQKILQKYGLESSGLEFLETPKEPIYFAKVKNILLLTNQAILESMKTEAEKLGYIATIENDRLEGNDLDVAGKLATEELFPKSCKLYGGEVTVNVKIPGKGGRCQEMILGSLPFIEDERVIVACNTDGWDNTEVAGALGDQILLKKSQVGGYQAETFLANNQSFDFFQKVGGHIDTGRTGINLSDIYFIIK